ncbi:hypothetical protein D3C87_2017970 [compost metagenome]
MLYYSSQVCCIIMREITISQWTATIYRYNTLTVGRIFFVNTVAHRHDRGTLKSVFFVKNCCFIPQLISLFLQIVKNTVLCDDCFH